MATEVEQAAALDKTLVQEFVGNAHGNLGRVKELLAGEPALVHCSNDWGGGDWETGLGAAAHMGRRDIAEYLLENGARMDVFAAAMLGHLEIVRSMLDHYPHMRDALGPHGIPLLDHARAGGQESAAVVSYLRNLVV